MGDLILTCTGDLSRNRRVGLEMAKGKTLETVIAELGHVAEGVRCAQTVRMLGGQGRCGNADYECGCRCFVRQGIDQKYGIPAACPSCSR